MATTFITAVFSLLCFPLVLLGLILIFTAFGCFLIVFTTVKILVKWFYNEELQISQGFDAIFFSNNKENKVVICGILDGHYNSKGIEDFKKFTLTARNEDGSLIAGNLQTLIEKKLGIVFRKNDRNFNFNDHFIESPRILKNKLEMKQVISEEFQREWRKNKPKWFLTFYKVNDCSEATENSLKKSLILFSFCHSITDGYAFGSFIYEFSKSINKNMKDFKKLNIKLINNLSKTIYNTFFFCPLFLLKNVFKPDNRFFKRNRFSDETLFSFLDNITTDRVRAIAKATRTFDFHVYISCFTAALHKTIKVSGSNSFGEMFTFFPITFRKPNDPLILSNSIFVMPMWLPVGEMKVLDRLQEIKRRTDEMRHSLLPIFYKLFIDLLSKCPYFVYKAVFLYMTPGICMSLNPDVNEDKQFLFEQELTHLLAGVNIASSSGVLIISHLQGRAFISLTANRNVFKTQEDVDRFLTYFEEEFESLEEIAKEEIRKLE